MGIPCTLSLYLFMLIDCHAHLHVKEFDADREEVIERARAAGVSKMINVGFDVEGNFAAVALAKKYEFIYATMGIHPHLASEWNDSVGAKIFETAKREGKIVALGEMGLDYYKNFQPKNLQEKAFRGQLRLARELDLPVIIHCRDAFEDTFKILNEEKISRVLLHCYTGTLEEANRAWGRGYYTAFTGIITYPSADALREVVKQCPLDKLLIETDCPFLAPQGRRGERNEPAYLKEIFQKVTMMKKKDTSSLESIIEKNTLNLFLPLAAKIPI